jgi:CheY-like chemotaxis protein
MTRRRILVVDDDEGVRDAVCDVLSELGYAAEAVSGAGEALDRFRAARYDLVVTDLAMPVMNGLQLARRLRALSPGVPIMIFSAALVAADPAPDVGGITLAHKPDVDELARLVQRALPRA